MNNLTATTKKFTPFFITLSWIIVAISICFIVGIFMFAHQLVASRGGETAYQIAKIYELANNYKQEIIWLQKAINEGNAYAANDLGVMYARGEGVEQSSEKAKSLYEIAAERGDYYGMYNLGLGYSNLNDRTSNTSPRDFKLAVHWYQKSMEKEANYCAANDLGILYATGRGVNQNFEKAKEYFRQSGSLYILQSINTEDPSTKRADASINYESLKFDLLKLYGEYQLLQAQHSNSSAVFQNVPPEVIKKAKDLSSKIIKDCWS